MSSDAETSSDEASAVPEPPVVLPNLVNTCYISTIVQVLLHTPLDERDSSMMGDVVGPLADKSNRRQLFEDFVDSLSHLGGGSYKKLGSQQDAVEFLGHLLENHRALALFEGRSTNTTTCTQQNPFGTRCTD